MKIVRVVDYDGCCINHTICDYGIPLGMTDEQALLAAQAELGEPYGPWTAFDTLPKDWEVPFLHSGRAYFCSPHGHNMLMYVTDGPAMLAAEPDPSRPDPVPFVVSGAEAVYVVPISYNSPDYRRAKGSSWSPGGSGSLARDMEAAWVILEDWLNAGYAVLSHDVTERHTVVCIDLDQTTERPEDIAVYLGAMAAWLNEGRPLRNRDGDGFRLPKAVRKFKPNRTGG